MKRTLRPIQCFAVELMTGAHKVFITAHEGKQIAWVRELGADLITTTGIGALSENSR